MQRALLHIKSEHLCDRKQRCKTHACSHTRPSPLQLINRRPLDASICPERSSNTENNCNTQHIIFTCPQDIKCIRTPSVSWLRGTNDLDPHSLFINIPGAESKMNNPWMDITSRQRASKNESWKAQTSVWNVVLDLSGRWVDKYGCTWPFFQAPGRMHRLKWSVAAMFWTPVGHQHAWVPCGTSQMLLWMVVSCQMNFSGWVWFIQNLRSSYGSQWLAVCLPCKKLNLSFLIDKEMLSSIKGRCKKGWESLKMLLGKGLRPEMVFGS